MGAKMKIATKMLNGRRVGQFVDVKNLDTNATVQEAISKGHVIGKKELVVSAVSGVVRSMVAGISRDGNGRKIDEVVSLQPSIRCKLADTCEPVTKDSVEAKINARVLKDGQIDASEWSFTIEGATGEMVIESITTGEAMNEVVIGKAIGFNGGGFTDAGGLSWLATKADGTGTQTGTVATAKRTVTGSRITTEADVLSPLTGSEWEGGTIVFTLKDGNKKAIKSATLRVAA